MTGSSSDSDAACIARDICTSVADTLGDLLPLVELWIEASGAPAPPQHYDENPLLATAALIVAASQEAATLVRPTGGSDMAALESLDDTLRRRLARARQTLPARHRSLMKSASAVAADPVEIDATLRLICRAAASATRSLSAMR
jgi:hypothetical protein